MSPHVFEAYESLPSLRQAAAKFDKARAIEKLEGPIRKLFLESGTHTRFGISLLHKHFSLRSNERLVDCRNVASPWTVDANDGSVAPKYNGFVVPRTFRVFRGEWTPFEFGYALSGQSPEKGSEDLFLKLSRLLQELELDGIFGVRPLGDYDPMLSVEITEGQANIMIPRGAVDESELIPAFWAFSPDSFQRCHCREYCFQSSDGKHVENHGCS